ncbi:hypothetical protein OE88DRAFT_1734515 [Heliocybe sulcata]|uniref:Uncharacterized protein n=1 Tax=Heliocybe sulcata TaxID=5364 RepID=A0A5C3NG80_9AGAM|nr:hypothetical protein OE88DRAFT_1734515 [Heliocybe sulcata]
MSTTEVPSSALPSSSSSSSSGTASPYPSETYSGSTDTTGHDTSSSLYLFTFLATLFLLLFVSCAIVLRSFILRRRFRRSMEEAIAAGIIFPGPQTPGYRKRNFGEKPVMWDVSVTSSGWTWGAMKPVSATTLSDQAQLHSELHDAASGADASRPRTNSILNRTLRPFIRRNDSAATFPSPRSATFPAGSGEPGTPTSPATAQASQVQVSVLIQMPSPHSSQSGLLSGKGKGRGSSGGDWEDEEFPDVVIGVAAEPCRGQLDH